MTVLTDTQIVTASGGLVELGYAQITSSVTVNGSDISVIGDLTVVCDGSPVLVEFYSPRLDLSSSTATDACEVYLWIDGVKSGRIAERTNAVAATGPYTTAFGAKRVTPAAGSHTFKITATRIGSTSGAVAAGVGTTTTQNPAFLRVSKIVQATQWPAVTTGTIICTSTTRPASPFEGQTIFETDTDLSLTWSGSAWVQTGSIGAWTAWTPTITQPGSISLAASTARFTRIGRTIIGNANVTINGTGTSGNSVLMTLPVPAAAAFPAIGSAWIFDNSTATRYVCVADLSSTTAMNFAHDASAANYWGGGPSIAIGSADQIRVSFTYEAAS